MNLLENIKITSLNDLLKLAALLSSAAIFTLSGIYLYFTQFGTGLYGNYEPLVDTGLWAIFLFILISQGVVLCSLITNRPRIITATITHTLVTIGVFALLPLLQVYTIPSIFYTVGAAPLIPNSLVWLTLIINVVYLLLEKRSARLKTFSHKNLQK